MDLTVILSLVKDNGYITIGIVFALYFGYKYANLGYEILKNKYLKDEIHGETKDTKIN